MQNLTASPNSTTETSNYSPSVPISVYRELSAELDTTKVQLKVATTQNQQLARENQLLRQEIEQLVQSAFRVQQAVNSLQPSTTLPPQPLHQNNTTINHPTLAEPVVKNPFSEPDNQTASVNHRLFTEQQETKPRRSQKLQARDLTGMWFAFSILLIVVAAFGCGYWVVRPMLLNNNR